MSTVAPERAEAPFILTLDIGTSSVRAVLFDRWGRAVEGVEARQAYALHSTTEGASEVAPDALLDLAWCCLDGALLQAGALALQIGGVAMCTFVNNILGLDASGRAVIPLTSYADTRAAAEVAGLRAEFNEEAVHQRTGCPFHPSYLPARLRWLAGGRPEAFGRVARWVSVGEYMELQLFGETAVSYSVASWTGLLNRHRLCWDEELLAALPVTAAQLSPLTDVTVPRRGLRSVFADRWPALSNVPWLPALGDGATANIGSGCVSPARVALTVGTTSAVRVVVDGPVARVPAGLWCYRVDRRRSLLGGALSGGGDVFAWMTNSLQLGDRAGLERALASMEPDAHGLTVLPFWTGERSPGWAGHARATLHGLSLATTPLDILRAGLEAVAYRIGLVFDRLQPLLPADVQVVASGGSLLSSPTWQQIMADVLGRPVAVSEVGEASSRGAALLALEALDVLAGLAEAPPYIGRLIEPDPARHARYGEARERQQTLYEKLIREQDEESER